MGPMKRAVPIEKEQTLKIGISMSATESLGDLGVFAYKIERLHIVTLIREGQKMR